MKSKTWLSINYFLQYSVQGVFFQYWLIYLTNVKGISVVAASSIFAMVYLARFISGVFFSSYLISKFGMKKAFRIISTLGLFFAYFYGMANDIFSLLVITFLIGSTFFTLTPLTETTASVFLKEENLDYGKVRVFGSFAFMLIGTLVGAFLFYISKEFIYYVLLCLIFVYVLFILTPMPKLVDSITSNQKKGLSFSWMKNDYNAILLILTFFMLQLSHAAYNNFSVLYIESLNISVKWLTGIIVNLSIVSEITMLIFSNKITKRIKAINLLKLACFLAFIRWLLLAVFNNVYIFAISQTFHAITFALAQVSFVLILNKEFAKEKILDMQNLYSAVGFQLAAFVGMYIVGFIFEISTSLVFFISAIIAFISYLLATKLKF